MLAEERAGGERERQRVREKGETERQGAERVWLSPYLCKCFN